MQIVKSKGQIVEKILRDKEGRLVRAKFFVYEQAGRIKARLIDVTYLAEKAIASASYNLKGFASKISSTAISFFKQAFSTFSFAQEVLYFSGSKPRAPTFV